MILSLAGAITSLSRSTLIRPKSGATICGTAAPVSGSGSSATGTPGAAYGYETEGPGGPITIRQYDPNWPDRDDVELHLSGVGFRQSSGEPLLGVLSMR